MTFILYLYESHTSNLGKLYFDINTFCPRPHTSFLGSLGKLMWVPPGGGNARSQRDCSSILYPIPGGSLKVPTPNSNSIPFLHLSQGDPSLYRSPIRTFGLALDWHWLQLATTAQSPSGTEYGHLYSSCHITKFFPPTVFLLLYTHHQLPSTTPVLVFIVSTIAGSSLNLSVLSRCAMYSLVKIYTLREASRCLPV